MGDWVLWGEFAKRCLVQALGIRVSGGGGAAGRKCDRFLLVRPVGVSTM